jgi:hypothetical protein
MADTYVDFANGIDDEATTLGGGSELRGSINFPYKTIGYAIAGGNRAPATQLTAGSTMYLRGGTGVYEYDFTSEAAASPGSNQGTLVNPIIITKWGDDEVLINGRLQLTNLEYYTFKDLTFAGKPTYSGSTLIQANNAIDLGAEGGVGTPATITTGIKFEDCIFKNHSAGNLTTGLLCAAVQDLEVTGCTFQNIRSRDAGVDGVGISLRVYADNVHIHNNVFEDISSNSIVFVDSLNDYQSKQITNILIEDNIFRVSDPYVYRDLYENEYPTAPEYHQLAAHTVTFSDGGNTITSASGLSVFEPGSTIQVTGSVSNNHYYTISDVTDTELTTIETTIAEASVSCTLTSFNATYCGENGVALKHGTSGIVVRNNSFSNCRKTGTNQDATGTPGAAISCSVFATGFAIYGNEFINCTNGISAGSPSADHSGYPYLDCQGSIHSNIWKPIDSPNTSLTFNSGSPLALNLSDTKNLKVYNNTFDWGNNDIRMLRTDVSAGLTLDSSNIVHNNIFIGAPGTTEQGGTGTVSLDANYNNWYTVTGLHAEFSGSGDITTDLQLDSNYIPSINGPAYRAGQLTKFNTKDFRGIKFSNPPSIGAYELAGSRMPAKTGRYR